MPSIKSVLADAAKTLQLSSDSALLDAEIILCMLLGKDRSYLRAWPETGLNPEQIAAYQTMLLEREQGKPIAYITGTREFWSRDFQVSPDVLIPRHETELIIELSLAMIPKCQPYKIIDLGTGSGIIAITLASERPNTHISASDISTAALKLAKTNAAKHNVEHILFYQSNWFEDVPAGKFDLIISNPPYLGADDTHLQEGDLRFEPKTALIAAQQGLADINIIVETAIDRLENGGFLLIEHGYQQKQDVQNIFRGKNYQSIQTYDDLSGQPRVTLGQYLGDRKRFEM